MSSHEVIKHSRRVMGIARNKESKLGHKLSEILIEVLIIVFAISLSLFLERWRQKAEDHELEEKFLQGLKVDLRSDLEELKRFSARCVSMKQAAAYFSRPEQEIDWSSDSAKTYSYGGLFHNVYFFPNTSRYESLKSSGRLGVIEDEQLQNDILDLYQTRIPDLGQQISFFNEFMNSQVRDYLIHNLPRDDKNQPVIDRSFFKAREMKNVLMFYSDLDDVLRRSDSVIHKAEGILKKIE